MRVFDLYLNVFDSSRLVGLCNIKRVGYLILLRLHFAIHNALRAVNI